MATYDDEPYLVKQLFGGGWVVFDRRGGRSCTVYTHPGAELPPVWLPAEVMADIRRRERETPLRQRHRAGRLLDDQ